MSHQVHPLQMADLERVTDIYNASCHARESTQGMRPWSVQDMKEFLFLSHPSYESYTCMASGTIVGWAALTRLRVPEDVRHTAEMSIYVHEPFRHSGIGTALAHTLLNRARILDVHCIFAMVFGDSRGAVSFAQNRCGMSLSGCLPEIVSDRGKHYDVLILEKLMAP